MTRESLWIASVAFGMVDLILELVSPETRWKKFRLWRTEGKIKLEDEEDEEDDLVSGLDGKDEYKDMESPVLTANIYER